MCMPGWLEVALRSVGSLIVMIGVARLFVRKPIGETSLVEYGFIASIVIILVVGSFQLSIPVMYVVIALAVWGIGALSIFLLSMKSASFRALIHGKEIPLMQNG